MKKRKFIKNVFISIILIITMSACGSNTASTDNRIETSVENTSALEKELDAIMESNNDKMLSDIVETIETVVSETDTKEQESISEQESEENVKMTSETIMENEDNITETTGKKEVQPDPDKPMVALTFDDGPNLVTTPKVLDLLEEYEITASFFVIGDNINMNNMSVVQRAYEMGCEINNHSKTHSAMTTLTAEEIQAEIEYCNTMVENITGEKPKFFRPPYIAVNDTMYENIDMPFICGVGCNDWEESVTAAQRAETVLNSMKDGTIVLLHDFTGNDQTVEALKTIIPSLLDQGYQFVTVSQLFEAKGVEISGDDTNLYSVLE